MYCGRDKFWWRFTSEIKAAILNADHVDWKRRGGRLFTAVELSPYKGEQ